MNSVFSFTEPLDGTTNTPPPPTRFSRHIRSKRMSHLTRTARMAIAIAIFPLIGYATAFAQTNKGGGGLPGDSLTVRTALEYAEASSPTLRTVKENIRALEAERRMSYGLPNPVVGYAEEGINPDASPAVAERRWFVSQSFDFPLATYHRLDRYDREIEALRHDLEGRSPHAEAGREIRVRPTQLRDRADATDARKRRAPEIPRRGDPNPTRTWRRERTRRAQRRDPTRRSRERPLRSRAPTPRRALLPSSS